MSEEVYGASTIKRRQRATKSEMDRRAKAILDIVEEIRPCTVRQVFYQAVVRGFVDKTEKDYSRVQRMLVQLRRDSRPGLGCHRRQHALDAKARKLLRRGGRDSDHGEDVPTRPLA